MMSPQGYQQSAGFAATERPMTEPERQSAKAIPSSFRNNAVGMSLVSVLMAIMINFVDNPVALIMPLFFGFIGLGFAFQARKSSGAVAQALAKGTVTDVRATPRNKGAGGWEFGPFSISKDGQLKSLLYEGVPASVSILPEAKRLLSVNMTPLRKPVILMAPAGLQNMVASQTAVPASQRVTAPAAPAEDLPPPPEGWASSACPRCGDIVSGDYLFCRKCGFRLKP